MPTSIWKRLTVLLIGFAFIATGLAYLAERGNQMVVLTVVVGGLLALLAAGIVQRELSSARREHDQIKRHASNTASELAYQQESGRFRQETLEGAPLISRDAERRHKSGKRIDVTLSTAVLRDTGGRIAGVVGVLLPTC